MVLFWFDLLSAISLTIWVLLSSLNLIRSMTLPLSELVQQDSPHPFMQLPRAYPRLSLEGNAPGGQAGTSSKIENYLGFPTGISGAQLASRGHLQALKFGVRFAISRDVISTAQVDGAHRLILAGGGAVCARSVVIASGARYRKLNVKNQEDFENRGLYYAATAMESLLCHERDIIVIGGGNSAGQASIFLSSVARHVHHIIRGASLESTMSQYLITRIERSPRITLYTETEIDRLEGKAALEFITWTNRKTGGTCEGRFPASLS